MKTGIIKISSVVAVLVLVFSFALAPRPVYSTGCCLIKKKIGGEEVCTTTPGFGTRGPSETCHIAPEICKPVPTAGECKAQAFEEGNKEDVEMEGVFINGHCSGEADCEGKYDAEPVTVGGKQVVKDEITNPACWPENECVAVCRNNDIAPCWGAAQPAECLPSYHYCYSDVPDIELGVYIGNVGTVHGLESYIALIYNYLIGVATILAIVMIMYGGFRWVTAAGNPERIGQAKQTIIGAVIGLVLALFSYTLLNVINPDILRMQMPRIKKVRQVMFEMKPVRCQDYTTEQECAKNKEKLNQQNGGCQWKAFGLGEQCTAAEIAPGTPGNVCVDGACSEGACIGPVQYAVGPHAHEYTTPKKWCTNGEMDMPCVKTTDCNEGLECDDYIYACVMKGKMPSMAKCSDDKDCSSKLCYFGHCRTGQEKQNCNTGGEADDALCAEKLGYTCMEFGAGYFYKTNLNYYCCPPSTKPVGEGCYIKCTVNEQCGNGWYCGGFGAKFKKQASDEKALPRSVFEWFGRCYKKLAKGQQCANAQQCESGQCDDFQYFHMDDAGIKNAILGPDGNIIVFPLEEGVLLEWIGIGTCE